MQAVAGLGPFPQGPRRLRLRSDGVHLWWGAGGAPEAPAVAPCEARLAALERRLAVDVARLAALRSGALALAAQPRAFGLEATPEVVHRLLKTLYV